MNRISIVQDILDKTKGKTYVEIGVGDGTTFLQIKTKRKIAIDRKFKIPFYKKLGVYNILKSKYFEMGSNEFFSNYNYLFNKDKIDVVLIDGLHTHKQSLKDVENCLKYLSEKGIIVMHDCNPITESSAYPASSYEQAEKLNLKGWTGEWCGDVWKTIVYLRSKRQDLNIFTLDCDYGIGIITKGKSKNPLNYPNKNIKNLLYKYLEKNRRKLLNLKNEYYFYKFLESL